MITSKLKGISLPQTQIGTSMAFKKELMGWIALINEAPWPDWTKNPKEIDAFEMSYIYGLFETESEARAIVNPHRADGKIKKVRIIIEEFEPVTYMKRERNT